MHQKTPGLHVANSPDVTGVFVTGVFVTGVFVTEFLSAYYNLAEVQLPAPIAGDLHPKLTLNRILLIRSSDFPGTRQSNDELCYSI